MKAINSENHFFENSINEFDDTDFIQQLRRDMLKFASIQLRDQALAEDAVQEALIATHQKSSSFNGKSALKTWIFAILKNKIVDILRKRARDCSISDISNDDTEDLMELLLFNKRGFWNNEERPLGWSTPMESVKNDHFWLVFETCLQGLPENLAQIFMMREFLELESDEICSSLGISTSNLHVMLYRARIRLRECLENRWFKQEGAK